MLDQPAHEIDEVSLSARWRLASLACVPKARWIWS